MERLLEIFKSLSAAETRYLKNYLTAFHAKGKNKALELVELMEAEPQLSQAEYSQRLYQDPKSKAFIMLKGRLQEKMLEVLMLSVNFQNNPAYQEDSAAYGSIELYKEITYALVLRLRGLDQAAVEILEKCVQVADARQLPEVKIFALVNLRNITHRAQDMWRMRKEIDQALRCYETDLISVGYFDELRVMRSDKTSKSQEDIEYLRHICQVLEERLEVAYSGRSHYYYLKLKQYYHEYLREADELRKVTREMISLLESCPGLGSKNRMGSPYLQLATLELKTWRFEAAVSAADQALSFFHKKKKNTLTTSICKIFSLLYLNRLEQALAIIREMDPFREQKRLEQSTSIVGYLEACHAYLSGELRRSLQLLNASHVLLTDKEGWNVGVRTFEIMILIDMEDLDLAASRIENLRKHLSRYQVEERQVVIYRCLQALERAGFSFSELPTDFEEHFNQLEAQTWSPLSHELIRFEWWVESRKTRSTYLSVQQAYLSQPV